MTIRIEGRGDSSSSSSSASSSSSTSARQSEISTPGPFLDPEGLKLFPGGWNEYFRYLAASYTASLEGDEKEKTTSASSSSSSSDNDLFRVDSVFNVECHGGGEAGIDFKRIGERMLPLIVREASGFSTLGGDAERKRAEAVVETAQMRADMWRERGYKWKGRREQGGFVVFSS